MTENYEERIILPPIQFQDKPIPTPRTKINVKKWCKNMKTLSKYQ